MDSPGATGQKSAIARKGPIDKRLIRELDGLELSVAGPVLAGLVSTASVVVQAVALAHLLAGAMGAGGGAAGGEAGRAHWFVLLGAGVAGRATAALAGEVLAAAGASRAKAGLRRRLVLAALTGATGTVAGEPGAFRGGPGELAALAGRGLDALDAYVGRCLPDLVLAAVAPLALLVAAGVLDWVSALVMAVAVVLFPLFGSLVGRASLALAGDRWRQVERLGRQVTDIFEGLPVLRGLGRTAGQRARIAEANEALRRSSSKVLRVAFLTALVLDTLGSVSVALVAVPLGLRLLNGSVRLSAALAILVVAPEVFLPLRRASSEFHESTEGLAAADRVLALIAGTGRPRGAAMTAGPRTISGPRAATIELRSLTVVLPGRRQPVLDDAYLSISPGEIVAVVGASGAGKSTMISLLLGFVAPSGGSLTVGGHDLAGLDLDDWRRHLTYLPEHPTLLTGTLADNLRLANAAATEPEMCTALARAGAGELLGRLPRGTRTPLGEGGHPVSSGERQQIALARVLLRPRSLYLLDEPTVHLDRETEAQVLAALRDAMAGSSAVVVSHRPAVLGFAHRVVALENGKLVPAGARLLAGAPA